jgi:hypothetical protein
LGERPDRWHNANFSLFDFHLLAQLNHASLSLIWKMKTQLNALRDADVEVPPFNGEINLLAYWWGQKWSFVPDDFPFGSAHGLIGVSPDTVVALRKELRTKYDAHGAPLPGGGTVSVHRRTHEHYFEGLAWQPLFASPEHAKAGELFAVVETTRRYWWISIANAKAVVNRDLAFRIWDAAINWTTRISTLVDGLLSGTGPLVISIDMSALDQGDVSDEQVAVLQPEPPTFAVTDASNISVVIPAGWRVLIRDPSNTGEKALLTAMVKGVAAATGTEWSDKLQEQLDTVFADSAARFLHSFQASSFRDYARGFHSDTARFIPPEDVEWTRLGVAWLSVAPPEAKRIESKDDCRALLHDLVDKLWLRIKDRLATFDRLSIVETCMERIESSALDQRAWDISMRALLALHGEQLFSVSRKHEQERNRTTLACRVLSEMAVCEGTTNKGKPVGESDLDIILADLSELIQIAYHSDAIHHEYAEPWVEISKSGRTHFDTSFYAKVVEPYFVEHFDDRVREAVQSYEGYLVARRDKEARGDAAEQDVRWAAAFEAEYGLTPLNFGWFVGALQQEAYGKKQVVMVKPLAELEALVIKETEQTAEAARKFLMQLTLPTRSGWDKTPAGFKKRDWLPWRFQRRLSAITRPFVQIDADRVVYSPGMIEDTLRYLVENSLSGTLPPDFFMSEPMVAWAGSRAASNGEEFSDLVHARVIELGLHARPRVLMSELGVPASLRELRQSDVDVLGWDTGKGAVFIIECKSLKLARTIGEIADQLNDFRKETDAKGKNNLDKHEERVEWLLRNRTELSRITGISSALMRIHPLIVTNRTVPMQFAVSLPAITKELVSYDRLAVVVKNAASRK